MLAHLLVCLIAFGGSGVEKVLDAFDYTDDPTARAAWQVPAGQPPVTVVADAERKTLVLEAPFAARPELPRVYVDRLVDLDLSTPGRFALDLECDRPDSFLSITLYFRSPGGWFSAEQPLRQQGRQTLVFRKDRFHTEGNPAGWDRIDAIRISAWQGQAKDADIRLLRLSALRHDVAIVVAGGNDADAARARRTALALTRMFDELGLGVDTIDQPAVGRGSLGDRALAVLPYNPALSEAERDALIRFVERGGKLLVGSPIPQRLGDRGVLIDNLLSPAAMRDAEQTKESLADVVGRLVPGLRHEMARHALDQAGSIGHFDTVEAVVKHVDNHVGEHGSAKARRMLDDAGRLLAEARRNIEQGSDVESRLAARKARGLLVEAYLHAQPARPREARAFWEHAGTGAYPGDWQRTASELRESGFNMILPNMLWGGAAHFASELLPPSDVYRRHGDQIGQCVEAAHGQGLEVHVWKVNWYLGHLAPKESVAKLDAAGRTQVSVHGTPKNWLCPSHPDNFKLELDSMLEVARRYPVDGLHFDYIRYPDREHCYCDGCRSRFEAASRRAVENWPMDCYSGSRKDEYNGWRCDQITRLVEAVSREARQIRPTIKISAAVFGSYPACTRSIAQDWVAWAKAGYVDFLCPMNYTGSDQGFRSLVGNQLRLLDGRVPIYPGIGATASSPPLPADRVVGQIHHARTLGAGGFTIFNLNAATAEKLLPKVGASLTPKNATPPHRQKP